LTGPRGRIARKGRTVSASAGNPAERLAAGPKVHPRQVIGIILALAGAVLLGAAAR
jgi:hypothetical protein